MHVELHPQFANTDEGAQASELLSACVHCGFCLATCPTYLDTRDERDSPRGRIYLIKQMLETGQAGSQTRTHLDRCLSCRSCETTCPSGIQYAQLLDIGRELVEQKAPRPPHQAALRWLLRKGISRPPLFALGLRLGQLLRPLLPPSLRAQIPRRVRTAAPPARVHARKMLLLQGCVQKSATPATNAAALRVFDRLGITLQSAPRAGCCGAVNYHLAAHRDGLEDMRRNIDAWWPAIEAGAEAIVSTATGCGSTLADYGRLLAGDSAYAAKATKVSALARDAGQVLMAENLDALAVDTAVGKVAVQTPCSLQHGLKQADLIGELLARAGLQLVASPDGHLCCGSAGTYSILESDTASRLRERKLQALSENSPDLIATGNVGCQLHLQAGSAIPVLHWIQLLDPASPAGERPR